MAKEEKCYPVPFGDVTICGNNKNGQCKLWNKRCDNIRKKEENSLAGWSKVIEDNAKQAAEQRKQWQEQIGEPDEILTVDDYKFGEKMVTHKIGFWKIKEGVLVVRFDKQGPDPVMQNVITTEFIEKLVKTLEK